MGAAGSLLGNKKLIQHLNLEDDKVRDRHKTYCMKSEPSLSPPKAKDKDFLGNLVNQNVK